MPMGIERKRMELTNDLVVLDLETTGTWVERDKIIEIALIKICKDGSKSTYDKRVNPTIPIPHEVSELTGISNEDVHPCPVFKDLAPAVVDFIGDADLGGFNLIRFDLPVLERECNEAGLEFKWRDRKIFDAQRIFHLMEKRDLTAAYKFYCQKNLENAHSAMADTQATLEILEAQVDHYNKEGKIIDELAQYDYKISSDFYDEDRKFRWWNKKLYIMFGKYAGKYSIQELVKKDRGYLEWILSSNFNEKVKELVENALNGDFPVREPIMNDKKEL